MVKALVGTYIAAVVALVAGAVSIWRLRCEGFGCMGVGVAWFAWVVAFRAGRSPFPDVVECRWCLPARGRGPTRRPCRKGWPCRTSFEAFRLNWSEAKLEVVLVVELDGELATELCYKVPWDEEHTLGARFRGTQWIELCGSTLVP